MNLCGTPVATSGPEELEAGLLWSLAWGSAGGRGEVLGGEGCRGKRLSSLGNRYVAGGFASVASHQDSLSVRCFAEIHSTARAGTGNRTCLRWLSGPGTSPSGQGGASVWLLTERTEEGERFCSSHENGAPTVVPGEGPAQSLGTGAWGTAGYLAADVHLICLLSPFQCLHCIFF